MAFMAGLKKFAMSGAGRGAVRGGRPAPTDLYDTEAMIGRDPSMSAAQPQTHVLDGPGENRAPAEPSAPAAPANRPMLQPEAMQSDAGPGRKVTPQIYSQIERVLKAAERNQQESAFNKQLGANLEKSPLMDRGYSAARPFNRNK